MRPNAKIAGLFVVIVLALVYDPALLAQTYLSADGSTDTYGLITSKLAPGANPIEVPDATHPAGSPHIRQVMDPDLGHYVFQFLMHLVQVTPTPIDNDPSTGDTDRQRNEIKTYASSPAYLKAYAGETVTYRWKFKLDAGFQPSPKFTHIHQIKPVDGNDSNPVITFIPVVSGGSNVMQLRYYDDSSDSPPPISLKQVPLAPFLGVWIEANEKITFETHGTYSMTLTRVSDGAELMSYSNSDINLLRTGASFYRPKWGIYRSVMQPTYLRDETVLFDNFCLAKGTDDCTAPADFDLAVTPQSQPTVAGTNVSYTATVTPNHGFNGKVALAVSGLPSGATASFDQDAVIGSGSSQVKIATTSTTAPGTYTITVAGTSGTLAHSVNLTLQVTPQPDFALSVTPSSQSVKAGDSTSYTATVTPSDGFNGVVAFGVSGLPAGATASFNNDSVTASGSVQLTVTTTSSTLTGTYPITVTGTSSSLTHSGIASLVITGQPAFALAVTGSSQTVTAGHSASYTATVTPTNGFNAPVTFSCSGLPTGAQCVFSPASVTPNTTPTSTTMTITTLAPSIVSSRGLQFWGFLASAMPVLFVTSSRRRRRVWVAALFVIIIAGMLASCGGGSSTTVKPPTTRPGTPAGTYTFTVTATSGSLQSSATSSLTVTP